LARPALIVHGGAGPVPETERTHRQAAVERARDIGWSTIGIGALAASVVFGVLWSAYGPALAFGVGAALALTATALLFAAVGRQP